jgi:hypothetical protein
MAKMSSTYLYQLMGLRVAWLIALSLKSSIKKFSMTEDNGETIAKPSLCSKY